jgi:D-proline reductase (dithiol) PrdB
MSKYDELSLYVRLFMKKYPFSRFRIDPVPNHPLRQPLSRSKVALVTTAGLCLPEQQPFNQKLKMGDPSWREIPNGVETQRLTESHRSQAFDHRGVEADPNLAFPLDRFRELEQTGQIGRLNHRHFSFMGSIIGPRPLIEQSAPEVARLLRADGVEAVFLTPL